MSIHHHTEKSHPAVIEALQAHGVTKAYLFGSELTPNFRADSDVDLLVTFGDVPLLDFADNFFELKEKLEAILGRRVDLLIEKDLRNPYLIASINRTKQLLFDNLNAHENDKVVETYLQKIDAEVDELWESGQIAQRLLDERLNN